MPGLFGGRMLGPGGLMSGGGASFVDPTSLPNLARWYAADKITGLSDAAYVASWLDSSANAKAATQAGADALKPTYRTNVLNGKPVVRPDGGDYLSHDVIAADPTVLTVFAVVEASHDQGVIWAHRSQLKPYIQLSFGTNLDTLFWVLGGDGSAAALMSVPVTPSEWMVISAKFDKTNKSHGLWKNGASPQLDATDFGIEAMTATREWIGAVDANLGVQQYLTTDLAELIIYSDAKSDADRLLVERYLGTKYAIAVA